MKRFLCRKDELGCKACVFEFECRRIRAEIKILNKGYIRLRWKFRCPLENKVKE